MKKSLSAGSVNSINVYAHGLVSGTGRVPLMFTVCLLEGPSLPNHVTSTSCLHTLSHGLCVLHTALFTLSQQAFLSHSA